MPSRRSGAPSPRRRGACPASPTSSSASTRGATRSARGCCEAGADLLNDAWGGVDPLLAAVAAEFGAGLVCTHAGGARPPDPPAPGGVRRRRWRTSCSGPSARPSVPPRSASPATGSSSTPATTSARTPATPSRPPDGSARWWPRDGRCWSRCPTRTSSGETLDRPVGRAAGRHPGDDRGLGVARGARVSRPQRARDAGDPRHGGLDPGQPPARRRSPRPRLASDRSMSPGWGLGRSGVATHHRGRPASSTGPAPSEGSA